MRTWRRAVALDVLGPLALGLIVSLSPVFATTPDGHPGANSLPQAARDSPSSQAHLVSALRATIPIEPITLKADPYIIWQGEAPHAAPAGTVCGVHFEPDRAHYRLSTFASAAAARTAGFAITHLGVCGTCSTLQDLAVYLEKPNLTAPVRKCGIKWHKAAGLMCLEDLGFTTACALTWLYDAQNTRHQCFSVCLLSWIVDEAPTGKNGELNACLQCDEDRSGAVFKITAGRTRRNSGIRSSIPRPHDEIAPIVHDYIPDLAPN